MVALQCTRSIARSTDTDASRIDKLSPRVDREQEVKASIRSTSYPVLSHGAVALNQENMECVEAVPRC